MRRRLLLPGYYHGPLGTNNVQIHPISSLSVAGAVSGQNISFSTGIFPSTNTCPISANSHQTWKAAIGIAVIGAADTVLASASIDGSPAEIVSQCNTGGYIAAIIYGELRRDCYAPNSSGASSETYKCFVQTTGTAPTSATSIKQVFFTRDGIAVRGLTSTTTADTVRSVTFPQVPRHSFFLAVGINDVATANSCTWGGTATSVTELTDAALSTARWSSANTGVFTWQAEGSGATVTSTWAVTSVTGVSLACALFSRDLC